MWSLFDCGEEGKEKSLEPLVFSNGKTQEDVVKEVISAIDKGHKVIFIKGVCGTGKSAIALNIAKELGRASIVVPVKTLQKQYKEDYTDKKYLLKNNNKLKIKIISGRANFPCPFLKEQNLTPEIKNEKEPEKDAKLSDFEGNENNGNNFDEINDEEIPSRHDESCDNFFLPCKIEIKEKNLKRIKEYLEMNRNLNFPQFVSVNQVRRLSIAPVCPYWSPIVPSEINLNVLDDAQTLGYKGLKDVNYTFYKRKKGCGYYDQYQAYLDADAIIFNSEKYKLETVMNRKPATDVEIIDECDEFLDSFSNQKKINLNRLNLALGNLFAEGDKTQQIINELIQLTSSILKDKKINEEIGSDEIIHIKETEILSLLQYFLGTNFMNYVECDEENYCYHCDEVARTFDGFFDETYLSFDKEEKSLIVKIVTINLEKRFKEMLDKNKAFVLMSGTIHSEKVLKDIFGISDFKIIDAETKMPGKITKSRTGLEINCRYDNFKKNRITREQYLRALAKSIEQAKRPVLVHVNAFTDLPAEQEAKQYNLNIMTREKLKQLQAEDSVGETARKFKSGKTAILYSTKCSRGIDFPGETCNSIILTKYPYPNINALFWKILRKVKPEYYDEFYVDKAKREFLQRIYRGLRSENDHVFLLSPDTRVLNGI